jgi:hypothetical protein
MHIDPKIAYRAQIAAALDADGLEKESDRYLNCGRRVQIFHSPDIDLCFGVTETCKSRICPRCCNTLYRQYLASIKQVIKSTQKKTKSKKKRISFLTLTWQKPERYSKAVIRRSIKQMREFMNIFYGKWYHRYNQDKDKFIKTNSLSGCGAFAVLEFGKSGTLHAHALVYGYYHPIKSMSKVWKQITGGSYRIDVRNTHVKTRSDPYLAARYILKYIQKPPKFRSGQAGINDLVAYNRTLKGIRRIHTYGIFFNHPGLKKEKTRMLCPVTGKRLKYVGTAGIGETVLSYHKVKKAIDQVVDREGLVRDMQRFYQQKKIYKPTVKGRGMSIYMQINAKYVHCGARYAKNCTHQEPYYIPYNVFERTELGKKKPLPGQSYALKDQTFFLDNLLN